MARRTSAGTEAIIVLTTVGSKEQAVSIAEEIVGARLAACVNIQPAVRSIYRWKDKIWNDEEFLMVIKTTRPAFADLSAAIKSLHSYELPEILALPVSGGDPDALAWIESMVDTGSTGTGKKGSARRGKAV